jgi:hypothetical protein
VKKQHLLTVPCAPTTSAGIGIIATAIDRFWLDGMRFSS